MTRTRSLVLADSMSSQYYISEPVDLNDLKGLAAFVLASIEYETLVDA